MLNLIKFIRPNGVIYINPLDISAIYYEVVNNSYNTHIVLKNGIDYCLTDLISDVLDRINNYNDNLNKEGI